MQDSILTTVVKDIDGEVTTLEKFYHLSPAYSQFFHFLLVIGLITINKVIT